MADFGMTNWIIDDYSIKILPGVPDEPLTVSYAPIGKYSQDIIRLIWAIFINMLVFSGLVLLLMPFLLFGLYYFLSKHPKIEVKIHDSGVSVFEKTAERFILFSEIETIEKGILCITLKAKNGQVIRLPRQCHYLFDFLMQAKNAQSTQSARA